MIIASIISDMFLVTMVYVAAGVLLSVAIATRHPQRVTLNNFAPAAVLLFCCGIIGILWLVWLLVKPATAWPPDPYCPDEDEDDGDGDPDPDEDEDDGHDPDPDPDLHAGGPPPPDPPDPPHPPPPAPSPPRRAPRVRPIRRGGRNP